MLHMLVHLLRSVFRYEVSVWMYARRVASAFFVPALLGEARVEADLDVDLLRRIVLETSKTGRATTDEVVARSRARWRVRERVGRVLVTTILVGRVRLPPFSETRCGSRSWC